MCCRGVQRIANPAYLNDFLFYGLPCVAPYCVPGGIRVVSGRVTYVQSHSGHDSNVKLKNSTEVFGVGVAI
jgi:hypothetical protein